MVKTHKLKVQPMTDESFVPFGQLIDIKDRPADERIISPLAYHADGKTTLSALWQPFQGRTFFPVGKALWRDPEFHPIGRRSSGGSRGGAHRPR